MTSILHMRLPFSHRQWPRRGRCTSPPFGVTNMGERTALVVTNADTSVAATWRDAPVVRTLLDMITFLERAGAALFTVILGGDFARDREISAFLREAYPGIDVVIASGRTPIGIPSAAYVS